MIKVLLIPLFFLFFSGCVDKKNVIFIDNMGLCTKPSVILHINDVEIQNNSQTFNITHDELTLSLINALKETNCFVVSTSKIDNENSLESKSDYLLDAKVSLSQDKQVIEENLFKKVEKEKLLMIVSLLAHNKTSRVSANAKSELIIDKSKILGFKTEADTVGDKRAILKNATKKVSISLNDGFLKLR